MPGRKGNSSDYRYGFQGQEADNDIKGEGNSINYKFRMHDPRVGRFFATDPLERAYAHNSPYSFAQNRVIDGVELEGLEWVETEDGWDYQGYDFGPSPVPQAVAGSAPSGSLPVAAWVSEAPIPQTGQVLNVGGPDGTIQQFQANENGVVELPHSGTEQTGSNTSGTFEIDGYVVYGYFNRNDVEGAVEDQYGTPTDIANMINAVAEFNEKSLIANPLQIGDMRSPTNGPTNVNSTVTHHSNNGSFDIRLLGENGGLPGGTTVFQNGYSPGVTQLLIDALGNNAFTRFFIGPSALDALEDSGTIDVRDGGAVHNNHYHVDVD